MLEWITSHDGRLLLWGLAARGLGLAFLACFCSIGVQLLPLAGSRGVSPIGDQLRHLRRNAPWYRCLQLAPGVLWLAHSDRALRGWVGLGVVASVGVVVGGPQSPVCFFLCYILALSFQYPLRLHYPWDASILEAGFLSLFFPPLDPLPALTMQSAPSPLLAFAVNFLIFRVVLGFGKEKFGGFEWRDTLNTRFFLVNIPSPSPIGWFVAKLPDSIHRMTFGYVAFAELICPWLLLVGGPLHIVGVLGIVGQMFAIQINSSFGFFNLFTVALCIGCLDTTATLLNALRDPGLLSLSQLPFTLSFSVIFFGSFLYFQVNSWVSAGFLWWPIFRRAPAPIRAFVALLRALTPLRMVAAYGVFSAHPSAPQRWVPIVEGTRDGVTWRQYPFRYQMTDETDRPMVVAPHHPRLEGLLGYEVFGVEATGWLTHLNFANPFWYTPNSMLMDRAVQRLLEPETPVVKLWRENPFPEGPPTRIRVALFRFTATTFAEWRESGRWWHKERVGLHLPETGIDPDVWRDCQPTRELFHWEAPEWALAAPVRNPTSEETAQFFDVFLPFVHEQARATANTDEPWTWETLPGLQLALRRRFTSDQVHTLRLTLGRLTAPLLARWSAVRDRPAKHPLRDLLGLGARAPDQTSLEARLQALAAWPGGPYRTPFHLGLAAHHLLLTGGRAAWERELGPWTPERALATAVPLSGAARRSMAAAAQAVGLDVDAWEALGRSVTLESGMFLEGVLNYAALARHANRYHVLFTMGRVFEAKDHGALPGAELLTRALGAHPELRLVRGWGEAAQLEPTAILPRMIYDERGVWHEPPRA